MSERRKQQPRCKCGSFVGAVAHDCAEAIDERLRNLAYAHQFHGQRIRDALSEARVRWIRDNPEAARQLTRRAWLAWMRPRLARRAAIDWSAVGRMRLQGLTWRRIAFLHREPETTFKRWARSELARIDCRRAA